MLPPLQKESSVEAGHQTLGSAENPVPVGHAAGAEVSAGHALQGPASRSRGWLKSARRRSTRPREHAFEGPPSGKSARNANGRDGAIGLSEGGGRGPERKKGAPFEGTPFLIWLAWPRCAARLAAGSSVLPRATSDQALLRPPLPFAAPASASSEPSVLMRSAICESSASVFFSS